MRDPAIATTATELAALTITRGGKTLTIQDTSAVRDAIYRTYPLMFPDPQGFVTGFAAERMTLGPAAGTRVRYEYGLNYLVIVFPVGAERNLGDVLPELVGWATEISGEIAARDDGFTVDHIQPAPADFVTVTDAAGNVFHGLKISFLCEEYG